VTARRRLELKLGAMRSFLLQSLGALGLLALMAWISPPVVEAGFLERLFVPQAELWERWAAHEEASEASIAHDPWNRFLASYVSEDAQGINRVAYGRVSETDRRALANYIDRLASTEISDYPQAEQLPYWINLYNALTVKVVLDHYPVASIRDIDISPGLFADGPWGKELVSIEGVAVSLDDIEHRILRPIWQDPRIHYAVNCAAVGCPDLQTEAFTAANTEALFDEGARAYVNDPRGVQLAGGQLIVSSIYAWFEEDFAKAGGVLAHLQRYAEPGLAAQLDRFNAIDDHRYDWALNAASSPR
jgi:hypothetical protein